MPACLLWGLWLTIAPLSANSCQHKGFEHGWHVFRKNTQRADLPKRTADLRFVLPVAQILKVSSGFGPRLHPVTGRFLKHNGVDFPLAVGTPVTAVADGIVIAEGQDRRAGNYVTVRHANGWYSRYLHLSNALVTAGRKITAGTRVGLSGNTGMSTGPHLHLEIGYRDVAVDPMRLLNQRLLPAKPLSTNFNMQALQPKIVVISNGSNGTKITVRLNNKIKTVSPGNRVFGGYLVVKQKNGNFRLIPDS